LIRLDSSTFITAMAAPARIVPGNSATDAAAARSSRPAASVIIAASSTRSSPSRRANAAAKPETTPKQITGVAARMEIVAPDRPSRVWSSGKIGGRLVIAPRRLKPSAITPMTSSVRSSRTRAGVGVALGGAGCIRVTSS
jgi:hypothetical protein